MLTTNNLKTELGEALGYMTFVLHLAPHWISGFQVCPMASVGCAAACLYTSGHGKFTKTQEARVRKTIQFFKDRPLFMRRLVKEINAAIRKAERAKLEPVFRLNATSDIRWETVPVDVMLPAFRRRQPTDRYVGDNIMEVFKGYQFYDYTKIPNRRDLPDNYHLTFSRSESNGEHVATAMEKGMNVAVVFDKLPETYMDRKVIDGTAHDLRFLDPKEVIVGLLPKADAKTDMSGFVVRS